MLYYPRYFSSAINNGKQYCDEKAFNDILGRFDDLWQELQAHKIKAVLPKIQQKNQQEI